MPEDKRNAAHADTGRSRRRSRTAATTSPARRFSRSSTATTVRVRDGETLVTDGPFAETKEQLGGYYLIEAPDLDEAIEDGAAKIPGRATGTIEVRPVMDYEASARPIIRGGGTVVEPTPTSSSACSGRSSGRAVATLIRALGDFDLAEDAVQEAFAIALERWPRDGVPANPGAWIVTTARNRAIDRLRRAADAAPTSRRARAARRAAPAENEEDDGEHDPRRAARA